jgi:hypothetical protein
VLEFFTAQINNDHTRKAYLSIKTEIGNYFPAFLSAASIVASGSRSDNGASSSGTAP